MKKFEYKNVKICTDDENEEINEYLNSLGSEGWELVSTASDDSMDNDGDTYTEYIWFTFKREITR